MSTAFENHSLAEGNQNGVVVFEVKCAELTPKDPSNILSGYKEENYQVKVLWAEETESGSIQVAFKKYLGLFDCLRLLISIEEKLSDCWLMEFVDVETLNCLVEPVKQMIISTRPDPQTDTKNGGLKDWLEQIIAKTDRRTSELVVFSIWLFTAVACGNLSRSDIVAQKFYQLASTDFWVARNWLDNYFSDHVNEIRNLHLYDKIDSSSQAAGESAIGQTLVTPQTASDLVLPEDISLEEMIKMIENIKGTIVIENLNIVVAE